MYFQELEDCEKNLEIGPEANKTRESSEDTNSSEDVDIASISDNEKLDCQSNASVETLGSQKLKSASSNSSLVVHVCTYEGCDKFFSRPFRLAQHIRTHTGEVSITLCQYVCRTQRFSYKTFVV